MVSPHLTTGIENIRSVTTGIENIRSVTTGIENIRSVTKEEIFAQMEEISPFIRAASFISLSILSLLNRNFNENWFSEREIIYEEVLRSIERFKRSNKLFVTVDNFVCLEHFRQRLTLLNERYTFRRPPEVFEFFIDNASLITLVEEAYRKIREYFPSAKLILEVFTDPEVEEEKELVIFIHTNLHPDEALNRLELLDKNWWLDATLDTDEKLCIHVEFE